MLWYRSIRLDRKSDGKNRQQKTIDCSQLGPGEVKCPNCKGSGWSNKTNSGWLSNCERCWGAGKLDWIEMAMGKPEPGPRKLDANWTMETAADIEAMFSSDLQKEILDSIGKEIAEKVDEEILGKIINLSVTKSKLR